MNGEYNNGSFVDTLYYVRCIDGLFREGEPQLPRLREIDMESMTNAAVSLNIYFYYFTTLYCVNLCRRAIALDSLSLVFFYIGRLDSDA